MPEEEEEIPFIDPETGKPFRAEDFPGYFDSEQDKYIVRKEEPFPAPEEIQK
jgi:hypothetical protein